LGVGVGCVLSVVAWWWRVCAAGGYIGVDDASNCADLSFGVLQLLRAAASSWRTLTRYERADTTTWRARGARQRPAAALGLKGRAERSGCAACAGDGTAVLRGCSPGVRLDLRVGVGCVLSVVARWWRVLAGGGCIGVDDAAAALTFILVCCSFYCPPRFCG